MFRAKIFVYIGTIMIQIVDFIMTQIVVLIVEF